VWGDLTFLEIPLLASMYEKGVVTFHSDFLRKSEVGVHEVTLRDSVGSRDLYELLDGYLRVGEVLGRGVVCRPTRPSKNRGSCGGDGAKFCSMFLEHRGMVGFLRSGSICGCWRWKAGSPFNLQKGVQREKAGKSSRQFRWEGGVSLEREERMWVWGIVAYCAIVPVPVNAKFTSSGEPHRVKAMSNAFSVSL